MPSLTVQIPGGEPEFYEFQNDQVTIGRSQDNSIIIPDDSLSSSHAQLVRNADGSYTLMDLGSTNGTYVDGEQISQQKLGESASLGFGQVTAYWQAGGAPVEAPAQEVRGLGTQDFSPIGRPANFKSISPIPKRVKRDPLAGVVLAVGVLSLLCAAALAGAVMTLL